MPHPIEPSTLRILRPTGQTVGTGFLVAKNLAVTCAHVIKMLQAGAGDTVDVCFTGKKTSTTARVLPEYWRPDEATDLAILQVDEVPAGLFPLRMGRASESKLKNDLYTFGYATAADEQGIGGLGTFITLKQEGNFIQFRMHEANHGHSGAPIYDDKRGVVVGMLNKGHTHLGRNEETTFAIPTETIWQVCPQLKPPTPVLPHRNPIVEGIHLAIDVVEQSILVDFDPNNGAGGRAAAYDWSEADELALAYAISVHKAQGSEFPAVVLPVVTQHYMMLQRNASTR